MLLLTGSFLKKRQVYYVTDDGLKDYVVFTCISQGSVLSLALWDITDVSSFQEAMVENNFAASKRQYSPGKDDTLLMHEERRPEGDGSH